ncbi:MAG TPA: cytochrome c3 family protein, partial [Longimicrobiales bacterium]|nr:cytochrome c3 family protein [Longimicrobiales bacterium]
MVTRSVIRGVVVALALGAAAVGGVSAQTQTLPTSEDCRSCHLRQSEERLSAPARMYDEDVHATTGFGCLACHGTGGTDQMDPSKGFLSAPARDEIVPLCARCHSDGAFMRQFNPGLRVDQESEYWTSVHGKRLREFGDTSVATCIDCHPAHDIRPPSDPQSSVHPTHVVETCARCHSDSGRMARYGIPTDQADNYRRSVHAQKIADGDLSAPVCNDCHGNHGAAPPGLASVRNVCGQCHSVMADFFDQSGHEEIFDKADMPGCVTCHSNHAILKTSDADLATRGAEVCAQCHDSSEPARGAFGAMAQILDSLDTAVEESRAVLEDAHNKGMEVSQALFELQDVTNAGAKARNAVHSFAVDSVRNEAAAGFAITAQAEERGEAALEEHHFRREGLAVSAGIIILLITALFLKVKDTEARADEALAAVDAHFQRTLGGPGIPSTDRSRLGASALLLEAAYTDDSLSEADRAFVDDTVRTGFGIPRAEADELISLLRWERKE